MMSLPPNLTLGTVATNSYCMDGRYARFPIVGGWANLPLIRFSLKPVAKRLYGTRADVNRYSRVITTRSDNPTLVNTSDGVSQSRGNRIIGGSSTHYCITHPLTTTTISAQQTVGLFAYYHSS